MKTFRNSIILITLCLSLSFVAGAQTQPLGPYGVIPINLTDNVAVNTASIAASQLTGILTGTPTAGATYTTDTATALCALFPFVGASGAIGFNWDLWVKNTSAGAFTITFAGGAGVTLVGTGTAAQNQMRHFKIVLTECRSGQTAAAKLVSLETAAF